MRYNVIEYGIMPNRREIASKKLQTLINLVAAKNGGTIYFPAGEYVLSTVFLQTGVKIELGEGATILGAESFYDYNSEEKIDYPLYQDSSHSYFHCSMFVGIDCEDIAIFGAGKIDMRSVWDEDNVRDIIHRGPKCIALKNCKRVNISGLTIINATDLAVYFAGCEDVEISRLKLRVYIDGISPDCCKNVRIHDCEVESGDDGIVLKSSYTLNRLDICKDIHIWNCKVKSRCSAIKFGTETNGGFERILIENMEVYDTRISGLAIESVDGAIIDDILIRNVQMRNVNVPIFIHIGKRMRGPEGREIGKICNVTLENITAEGPYESYEIMPYNYFAYKANNFYQKPWIFRDVDGNSDIVERDWQMTSNICGLQGNPLENITLRNIRLLLDGGVQNYEQEVPEEPLEYPEPYVYGRILPAKGIYFRHINGLTLDNVTVETYRDDKRDDFVFENVVFN